MYRQYNLCYWHNGKLKALELKNLDYFREKENITLKDIDDFTTQFINKREMMEYLRENGLIEHDIKYCYITYNNINNEEDQNEIYCSKNIFYKSNKELLDYSGVERFLIDKAINFDTIFIEELCNLENKKYKERIKYILSRISNSCKEMTRNTITYEEAFSEYKQAVRELLNFELLENGILKYEKLHNFVNSISLVQNTTDDIMLREAYQAEKDDLAKEKNDVEMYNEDNLTLSDYKKQIKEELEKLEIALTKNKDLKYLYKCFKKKNSLRKDSIEYLVLEPILKCIRDDTTYDEFERIYNIIYYNFSSVEELEEHLIENAKKGL